MRHLKKCAAVLLMAVAASPMFAQDDTANPNERVEYSVDKYRVVTNKFWNNWFVSVGGGAQIYFGDHDRQAKFGDCLAPNLDIAVGKWFTPGIGIRFMYSGLQIKGATKLENNSTGEDVAHGTGEPLDGVKGQIGGGYELQHSKFDMMNLHADVLFNLTNLLCGYRPARFYNISAYAGLGWGRVFESPNAKEVTANIGILNSFRLCDALDLNLDVRGMFVNDRFDGEEGGRQEGLLSASIGLTYKFKSKFAQRGWTGSKTVYRYDESALNEMRNRVDQLTRDNEALRKALKDCESQEKIKPIVNRIASANLVTFKINKTNLSHEARANLGMLAEVIKKGDSDAVYTITGYADKGTGSVKGNERLSKGRADAVYNCLVNEFGVNPSQLRKDYKGGVDNMFYDDPRLSRAVITRAAE